MFCFHTDDEIYLSLKQRFKIAIPALDYNKKNPNDVKQKTIIKNADVHDKGYLP